MDIADSLEKYFHTPLAQAQEYLPLLGMLPAALQAVVSIIQAVVGLLLFVLAGLCAAVSYLCSCTDTGNKMSQYVLEGAGNIGMGTVISLTSIFNIATLGIYAYCAKEQQGMS